MGIDAHKIIQDIEDKAFNEGFKAGWYAATKQINEALKNPKIPFYSGKIESLSNNSELSSGPFRAGTESAKVYDYIKENPGKRGNFIIAQLKISPKSARNAFHRLKKRGIAVNNDGWRVV